MNTIFHERQEGSLCAQHCLNALLQGPYFNAVDLAELAAQLDQEESDQLGHVNNSRTSHNMNEEGYFSVQVISKALSIWSLELVPFLRKSPEADAARAHPENQQAFVCNFQSHWFTIRRFGPHWFNLDSTLSKPGLISPTYLTIYLAQLQQEGHSIFFVSGPLPSCEAERLLSLSPLPEEFSHPTASASGRSRIAGYDNGVDDIDDEQVQLAMAVCQAEMDQENLSLQRILQISQLEAQEHDFQKALELSTTEHFSFSENDALEEAIRLSLSPDAVPSSSSASAVAIPTSEEIRNKRQMFLDRLTGAPHQI
ncbi:unnamed protein product [Dicrocoelium dendriticum]|nr:unnamed protein product [Dicrocoelium dendriticum]